MIDDPTEAFERSLTWRPIAEFDDAGVDLALLRAGGEEAFGYCGPGWDGDDRITWRNAQESHEAEPLGFEPQEFACVDDEWRVHLMAD